MSTHFKTLIAVAGVMIGIACGEMSMYASDIAVLAILLVVTQAGLFVYRRWSMAHSGYDIPLATLLLCLGLFLGIVRVQLVEEKTAYVCESSCTFEAVITSSPDVKDVYQVFAVRPMTHDDVLDVQIRTPLYPRYEIGETISLSGKVTVPRVIAPHADGKGGKTSFDYASYLLTRNVGSEMLYPKIEVVDASAHDVSSVLGRWKEDMVARIDQYVSAPASSLAAGMIFGTSSLSKELTQTFRTAGLSHIIVLSGFNIAVLIAAVLLLLAWLPLVLRVITASVVVVLFVIMVGGEASVIRATLVAFVALLATLVGRAYVARQALILSFFAIVMYEPYALLHDVSLHLSFLATAGIVYMSESLTVLFQSYCARIAVLREVAVTTVAAYLATLPYVVYTFGTASLYALIANMIVLPFVPLAMLLSFCVVVFSYLSGAIASCIGFIDTILINGIVFVAHLVEWLPFSALSITLSLFGMCLCYVGIVIVCMFVSKICAHTYSHVHEKDTSETLHTKPLSELSEPIPY